MARTSLLLSIALVAMSGCYMSHQLGDPFDAGPCARGRCGDASVRDAGRFDAGPPIDSGPPRACVPGETQPEACGHCGRATRSCLPDSTWSAVGECLGETEHCGVDLMLLADVTGSHTSIFQASETTLTMDLIEPLERDADVRVGVSAFADYPYGGYGSAGSDRPFIGVLHLTHDVTAVDMAISGIMFLGGSDGPEAEIAGLDELSGGTPHPTALPFACAAGEVAGGCWRPAAAWHVIVVMTDTASHNLPDTHGGYVSPYDAFVDPDGTVAPPAPLWPVVRAQLVRDGTYVYWIVPDGDISAAGADGVSASAQAREIALQLGEVPEEAVFTYTAGSVDTSFAVRAVRMAMTTHFGIHTGP